MGKLAERLSDAARSGVYRVESTEALEEAVALNGFALKRIVVEDISGAALYGIAADAVSRRTDGDVLLFSGFEALARGEPAALDRLFEQLHAATVGRREGGLRFFAVFLDPLAILSLAQLYNWHRSAATKTL